MLLRIAVWLLLCAGCSGPSGARGTSPPDCGDTANDPYHCGACDHTCWGGMCSEGACQPVSMLGPEFVAQGDVALACADGAPHAGRMDTYLEPYAFPLFWSPTDAYGYPLEPSCLGRAEQVALAGELAYWAARDGIYRCDVGGCPGGPERVVAPGDGREFSATPIALNGETLLFVASFPTSAAAASQVNRIVGCTPGACASTEEAIYEGTVGAPIVKIRSEGSFLAFVEGASLRGCELDDCQDTVRTIGNQLTSRLLNAHILVEVAAGQVAWREYFYAPGEGGDPGEYSVGRVMICPQSDCSVPTVALDSTDYIGGIAIAEDHLWIGRNAVPGLVRCPLSGCAGAPEPVPWLAPQPGGVVWDKITDPIAVTPRFLVIGGSKVTR